MQPNARTVQGALEGALSGLLGEPIRAIGAGRTDAGVHATGQVIGFRTASAMPEATIRRGVNALLPADVALLEVVEVPEHFHARYSATGRGYEYTIWNYRVRRPLLRRTALWVEEPLDVGAMSAAARHLLGRHDFSSFSATGEGDGRERTVRRASWRTDGALLVFEVEADAFLRGMVRGIVGTLLAVGRGRLDAEGFAAAFRAADRGRGASAAPPHGLCLVRVDYDGRHAKGQRLTEEDE